ncbi:DVU_1555 family C-GCAxxG-C-C protein [Oleidesulfovibrio sp.]|uniref:DVU_1555 family C-GCAxxG-C-C protein n=1 Tax=Oleidesulfovibrio sp. TaxID=2909707 RepID=UPI003A83F30C
MLDDTSLTMMRLAGQGYCCSQIILLLALEGMGRENPDLVRAAAGLCHGGGSCDGPCGIVTGGNCLLALYTAKGHDNDQADERLPMLIEEFGDWFTETTVQYGGISCGDITGGECRTPDMSRCGTLIATAYARLMEILDENGIDPATGKDE